jgi:GNAT superfamily N-acetyltransferase
MTMTEVRYRLARKEDIPAMADVFFESITDLYSRRNLSLPIPPRPAIIAVCEYNLSTGIFHVAELEKQIVAIACAVVRDHIGYLSAFFARPNQQRKGISMPLLKRVWNAGKAAGASIFCTHSSMDITAMAVYMKLGMLPGHQILYFGGKPERLSSTPSGYEVAMLDKHDAMEIDQEIRGTGREPDHEFWLGTEGFQGRQVLYNGSGIGYFYLGWGSIGPAAWKRPQDAKGVMALACREAAEIAPEISFCVPGINHAALQFAFDSGMRLTSCFHFLTTTPFGRMDQYIPSGPSLY